MPGIDKSINWYVDKRILSECMYFGVEDKMYNDLIRQNNPNAISLNFSFCAPPYPTISENITKEFDFVNFAMQHSDKKGTPDSIIAMAKVVKRYPKAKLNIVGGCESDVKLPARLLLLFFVFLVAIIIPSFKTDRKIIHFFPQLFNHTERIKDSDLKSCSMNLFRSPLTTLSNSASASSDNAKE